MSSALSAFRFSTSPGTRPSLLYWAPKITALRTSSGYFTARRSAIPPPMLKPKNSAFWTFSCCSRAATSSVIWSMLSARSMSAVRPCPCSSGATGAPALGERGSQLAEADLDRAEAAVQQHERPSLPLDLVVHLQAVHRRVFPGEDRGLLAGQQLEPGFDDVPTLSTRYQRFTRVRLPSAHLTGSSRLFRNAHYPSHWARAACGGLDPDPAARVRGACPHLLCGKAASGDHYCSLLSAPSWRTVVSKPQVVASVYTCRRRLV